MKVLASASHPTWITFCFWVEQDIFITVPGKENTSTVRHEVPAALNGKAATMFRFDRL